MKSNEKATRIRPNQSGNGNPGHRWEIGEKSAKANRPVPVDTSTETQREVNPDWFNPDWELPEWEIPEWEIPEWLGVD